MYSDVRGTRQAQVHRPDEHPALRFNYLSTRTTGASGSRWSGPPGDILNQPAFAAFNAGELRPGPAVETDQEILDWVAKDAETALHPSCTARMGVDDDVGPRPGRRCACTASRACASWTRPSMPYVTNGNIYAPVMMLAEKAADLILGNTPAAPVRRPVLPLPRRQPLYPPTSAARDRRSAT